MTILCVALSVYLNEVITAVQSSFSANIHLLCGVKEISVMNETLCFLLSANAGSASDSQ